MNKYILLAAVAIMLIACDNDDNYIDDPVAAQISATIQEKSMSRARDITWDSGDSIGISMSGRYLNMKYITADGTGAFDGAAMYFKNKQEPVTISAYYPFAGSEKEAPSIVEITTDADRQNTEQQAKFDFMFASAEGLTGANPNVNLQFSHKMSKLTFVFKNGDGMNVNKLRTYTIEGLILDGTFDPATGVCAAKSEATAKPLTISLTDVVSEKAMPSLLLLPQTIDKLILKITDSDDQNYSCELKLADNSLASGNNYLFTITVNKTKLSVNQSIIDWREIEVSGDATSDDSED